MSFLTLEEAKIKTGKSESTLRRFIKKIAQTKKNSPYLKIKKLKNGGYQYFIHIDILKKKYPILEEAPKKKSVVEKKAAESGNGEIDILKQYIQSIEQQLFAKDHQISEKDKQIFELLERDKESNLLLEKINQALIQYKIPEYIETQLVSYTPSQSETQWVEEKKAAQPSKTGKASFTDWLNDLDV